MQAGQIFPLRRCCQCCAGLWRTQRVEQFLSILKRLLGENHNFGPVTGELMTGLATIPEHTPNKDVDLAQKVCIVCAYLNEKLRPPVGEATAAQARQAALATLVARACTGDPSHWHRNWRQKKVHADVGSL